jgi:hypothetical protein
MIHRADHNPISQDTAECQVCSGIRHRAFNEIFGLKVQDPESLIARINEIAEEFAAHGPAA